ncbi:Protein FAR1-RELATED SEQUENCE 5 [Striga hermonthica]|uniref:Protein FAR1-RELATED SEQUENCE 5 n=1 Tax=Striga hermonthica TaxID=68872 RepID=A0A9N7N571_STRHE|nr:Protein FAR1-RELATED SEQUENCE 5 [Striga hermonthica]
MNENEIIEELTLGMVFKSQEEAYSYYSNYGIQKGFGVMKRSSKRGDDGVVRYFTFACVKNDQKKKSTRKTSFVSKLSTKTGCQAKIRLTLCDDGNIRVTTIHLDHDHLLSPGKARHFRCNRKIDDRVKRRLEINDEAGIGVSKNYHSLVVEANGYENVTFNEKDCRNHIEKARRSKLGVGDAEAVCTYFAQMQEVDKIFFYVMDIDEESRIRNLFWADGRSRAAYEAFGDVITFDTTYLTNKYKMPFAPFVGVNHHGQSVLFGCGLLTNEDTESFVWLFESWLKCMSGCRPKGIITDQCNAMKNAIEIVFGDSTRHRLCLWHIMKKIPEKLSGHSNYEGIKNFMQALVYDALTEDEFDSGWLMMIDGYNLHDNEWLQRLYADRKRWVPAYVKSSFWVGMSTTQRSEGMNAFFKGFVNHKTTLKQFIALYEQALKRKVEKETVADYESWNSRFDCLSNYDIEKQFQSAYTNVKFREFQDELRDKFYCQPSLVKTENSVCEYKVEEDVKVGDIR